MDISLKIALAAVAISSLAFIVSGAQTYWTRKHNRLSTRPFLGFTVSLGSSQHPFGIYLQNDGIGPAILGDLQIYVRKRPVKTEDPMDWTAAWESIGFKPGWQVYGFPTKGSGLQVGDTLPLVTADHAPVSKEASSLLIAAIKIIDLKVTYSSLYGETFEVRLSEHLPRTAARGPR